MSNTVPEPTKLTPEAVIAQLRTMSSQIEEVTPLTQEQRKLVKQRLRPHPKPVVEASISVLGVPEVSQAIGQPLDDVRRWQDESLRWETAADEARAFLRGIEGANLIRRQRITLAATQAYSVGTQLAKIPAKAALVPHVEEVKRLKSAARSKKKAKAAQKPTPTPAPAHDTSTTPKP
jgi:uncharacterized small protein (DUF1192 family)